MLLAYMLVTVAVLTAYWILVSTRHPPGFPPGPSVPPLPVLGHRLLLGNKVSSAFRTLAERYGDAVGLWFGPKRAVILNNFELISEAGAKDELQGRLFFKGVSELRGNDPRKGGPDKFPGVLFSVGRTWQEQRRFSLQALRGLGFGKNATEELMREEAAELCTWLESTKEKPVDIRNKFNISILNALWRISTSERLSYDDPRLARLILLVDEFIRSTSSPIEFVCNLYRPLMWISSSLNLSPSARAFTELRRFIEESVASVKDSYQEDSLRNFVDHYLQEIAKRTAEDDDESSFSGQTGMINLTNVLIDLFMAGSETTSTTLSFAMLYLITHPEVQERVHAELDEAVGRGVCPTYEDRARTPYVEAVLHETQRLASIVPFAPHHATTDIVLGGHFIPADTMVFHHLAAVTKSPANFPDPDKFDPSRFVDPETGSFKADPRVTAFGVGKRRCLGETLARTEMYVFFTAVLSRFRLELSHPGDAPSLDPLFGVVLSPQPYKLRFVVRS